MTRAVAMLSARLLSEAAQEYGNHGCNDMDMEVFADMTASEITGLLSTFHKWDRAANPEDWEPRKLAHIPDFLWFHFCAAQVRREAQDAGR